MAICLKNRMLMNLREQRKHDHLKLAIALNFEEVSSGLEDVILVHQALPKFDLSEIKLDTTFDHKKLAAPLIINAITGGTSASGQINGQLAKLAHKYNIAMAVGSQKAAIDNKELAYSYEIARENNPDGVLFANISANCNYEDALEAINLIKADGIQLHLNCLQELLMAEGDRVFSDLKRNIAEILKVASVPVIIKEVGNGLSRETVLELQQLGIEYFDISGLGGTNFAQIENARNKNDFSSFGAWGIPTACSIIENVKLDLPIKIIASGGIRTGLDMAKALALGANYVGIAGKILKILIEEGLESADLYLQNCLYELKVAMLVTNCDRIENMINIKKVLTGKTKEWLEQR